MGNASKFWDRIAARYARSPVADEAAYQKKLEIARGYLHADARVLEFGCGTGSTAIAHAPHVAHIRAIDISSKMLEIAREKAATADIRNVDFEQEGIETFEADDQSFDAVLGFSILHLLPDRHQAIAKVYRLLKPGGAFVSSTACLGDRFSLVPFIVRIGYLLGLLPMVKVFSTSELLDSLTRAGFRIDHQWQPGKGKAVFIVAIKPG
jgi:ubiquinone/menaquinone biosynthesis C-methylase UbiE